ncbi:MAG: Swt1 family HEPN domain-containing protein [Phycisphaerales bacterium]
MAVSNRDRVGKALDLLKIGLYPFVERELKAKLGDAWEAEARKSLGPASPLVSASPAAWDTTALLSIIDAQWQYVFRFKLGKTDRSLVFELRDVRNRWAHQEPFGLDDTNRALDSAKRLLIAVNSSEADEVDKQLQEVLRQKYEDMTKKESKKAAAASIEGKFSTGLPSWREIITPHSDVAGGNYLLAEFAADLWQVYQDQFDKEHRAPTEYTDPVEFFRRTYLTDGLADLLTLGIKRICGQTADPVVKLQTNFGGGKTHSMLALYHLFSGVSPSRLAGIEPLLKEAGVTSLPKVHRAVLVGNKLSLTGFKKPDGITINTLWGELAWQLGHSVGKAKEAYDIVRADDEKGVCPGGLVTLLRKFSPCIVLIDEWVAFVRQVYGTPGLAAGSFDANITFAQSLTEAFKAAPNAFLVGSLPSSDIEIGGDGGREALKRLENTFDRVQSTWRPASTDECFEIVRRRLFQPMDASRFAARDAVARAFAESYRQAGGEFPPECKETEYERRIQNSYPIHPELFDRLFQDWAALDRFQKTRGVLRLMASVIHSLWERQDGNLLIMPATVPMDDPPVRDELTRYMDDPWTPVIEKDVDGPNSLPLRIDRDNPSFGRVSAARRVARTLYLGSAPTATSQNRGIDDRRIKLGCVQPGEQSAVFGDALRRLSDQATHVYVDQSRYWLATQPSVARLAQDRAAQLERKVDDVHAEIVSRLFKETNEERARGDFGGVHCCPDGSENVSDDRDCRLVVLAPALTHAAKSTESPALGTAKSILESRGSSPRLFRNALVFLAADKTRLPDLEQATRQYLAWRSIHDEAETLNLDAFQRKQANSKCHEADDTVRQRIPEAYQWLLVPSQPTPQSPIEWSEVRLQGAEKLALRASKKLINDGGLAIRYAGTLLRMELDRVPLWRGESVSVKQLVDDFAQYLYLPRLKSPQVLLDAVRDGVNRLTWQSEGFAYADFFDEKKKRFVGLRTVNVENIIADGKSLVVKSDSMTRQQSNEDASADANSRNVSPASSIEHAHPSAGSSTTRSHQLPDGKPSATSTPRRFFGVVELDATRLGRDAGRVAQEVLAHLVSLKDSNVTVSLEINAEVPHGVDEPTVRTVTENCRVLKFKTHGFESH